MKDTRTTKPVTISLPPQLITQADSLIRESGKTRSEIFREALQDYFDKVELARLRNYGRQQAVSNNIRPADIESLVSETRQAYYKSNPSS